MATQWFIPGGLFHDSGVMIQETTGEDEWFIPGLGMFNEKETAAAGGLSIPVAMRSYRQLRQSGI